MKKKIELVCWILFTVFSGIGFFINFMSKPPVNDTHTFTLYMIGAAVVSLLYPASMVVLGLRNRYLYDKLNELHLKTGYSRAKISVYMKNLGTFHIVEKETSFETGGWENTKKGVYRIKDNYVNFWFRFVYPHLSELYMMSPEQFYDAYITSGIDEYLERYFKEVCMEYVGLLNLIGKLPMKISKMGTWIGKEGNIDIIAQNSVRENIVGYCNWNQPEFTMEMKEELLKSMKQAKIDAKYFFLFSAKGFSEEIRQLAEEDTRYILVDMNEL